MFRVFLVAGCLLGCVASAPPSRVSSAPKTPAAQHRSWAAIAREVTIHRDEWGVPHVFGPTDASVVLGYAFARAEDEFERMERAVYVMLGRNAEVLGEPGLAWDRLVHAFEIPRRAQDEYQRLEPRLKVLADAWAAGVNLYLEGQRGQRLIERFEPWHVVAQGYALHLHAAAAQLRTLDPSLVPPEWSDQVDGSNAFAVAPSQTAAGHPLLLINPHIDFEEVYEAHLVSDEGLEVSGANSYGRGILPIFGTNRHVAWSLTVNRPDVADTWRVRFEMAREGEVGRRYRYGNTWERAFERAATVQVLGQGAKLETRELRWLETRHGPVLANQANDGFAVNVAGMERGGALGCAYDMALAGSIDETLDALRSGGLLFHNVVAADADGHIGYIYNGLIPRRDPEYDWRHPVNGNDPGTAWNGYHELADLPQVVDPKCGWVQNCNSRPEATFPGAELLGPDAPSYLVGDDKNDGRLAMAEGLLNREQPFTFEDWCAVPFDRRVFRARAWIKILDLEVEAMGQRDSVRVRDLVEPMAELHAWDGVVSAGSIASTLFLMTYQNLGDTPPIGSLLVSALERTIRELRTTHATWRVAWGQVNRHQRARGNPPRYSDQRKSWPVEGGHASSGLSWSFRAKPAPGTLRRYGHHGNSYVAAIEVSDPPRIRSIVPFGSSRDPDSQHFQDQAPLFARGELKQAWFTRSDVQSHAQRSYSPGSR